VHPCLLTAPAADLVGPERALLQQLLWWRHHVHQPSSFWRDTELTSMAAAVMTALDDVPNLAQALCDSPALYQLAATLLYAGLETAGTAYGREWHVSPPRACLAASMWLGPSLLLHANNPQH
jgi:hypothetical protein